LSVSDRDYFTLSVSDRDYSRSVPWTLN
jgi:hypothetical protein